MAKVVRQYRYYGSGHVNNQPVSISSSTLASGSVFFERDGNLSSIVQLGIQTIPGVKFYLNNGIDPIFVGSTGIYELDLNGLTEITALSFDKNSISTIQTTNGAYLIVDVIYEAEEE